MAMIATPVTIRNVAPVILDMMAPGSRFKGIGTNASTEAITRSTPSVTSMSRERTRISSFRHGIFMISTR